MSAICAGCLEPIPKQGTDSKFVLSGTEVFHTRCAHLIANSVVTRYRVALAGLKSKLAEANGARHTIARLERELRDVTANAERWRLERNEMHERVATVQTQLDAALRRVGERFSENARLEESAAITARDLATARAELAEAKAELARIRGPDKKDGTTAPAEDDFKIRSALLELD